jgi:hypothetical protein
VAEGRDRMSVSERKMGRVMRELYRRGELDGVLTDRGRLNGKDALGPEFRLDWSKRPEGDVIASQY